MLGSSPSGANSTPIHAAALPEWGMYILGGGGWDALRPASGVHKLRVENNTGTLCPANICGLSNEKKLHPISVGVASKVPAVLDLIVVFWNVNRASVLVPRGNHGGVGFIGFRVWKRQAR